MRNVLVISFLALAMIGCSKPPSPEEVTLQFWQALEKNDEKKAAALALPEGKNPSDMVSSAEIKEIMINSDVEIDGSGTVAKVPTRLVIESTDDGSEEAMAFNTILKQIDDNWLVDIDRTGVSILGHSFKRMAEEFEEVLSESLVEGLESLEAAFGESLESFGEELSKTLEEGAVALEKTIDDVREELQKEDEPDLEFDTEVDPELDLNLKPEPVE